MKYLLMIVLLFSFGQASAAIPSYKGGNDLLEYCYEIETASDFGTFNAGMCAGYILGAIDADRSLGSVWGVTAIYCVPDGVTVGQLVKIVRKYLLEYPEELHQVAAGLVIVAIAEVYPCE